MQESKAKVTRPKGTYDLLPNAPPVWRTSVWRRIEASMRDSAAIFGFEEIRTPMFESTALFKRGVGDTTDIVQKEMYTFDHGDDESLTLRPEGTSPVVRSFIENGMDSWPTPLKLYYIINCFRAEKPQKGRYRQFSQFGAEIFGVPGARADAEVIGLASSLIKRLGVEGITLEINSVGCPECRPGYFEKLRSHFEPQKASLCPDCRDRLARNPMRILDCKEPGCKAISESAPKITEHLCAECSDHFSSLREILDSMGIEYVVNETIVRGLDYYTKTAFEFLSTDIGAKAAVCAGGRYDGLVATLGGPPTPGVGFGMGLERLLLLMEAKGLLGEGEAGMDFYVAPVGNLSYPAAIKACETLRGAGFKVATDLMDRSLKAQMKYADKLRAARVVIIGEDELARGEATVRDMNTKEQVPVALAALAQYAKELIK